VAGERPPVPRQRPFSIAWFNKAYASYPGAVFLGADATAIDRRTARVLGYPVAGELAEIPVPGGPAGLAGIRGGTRAVIYRGMQYLVGGDLIVAVNGHATTTDLSLSAVLGRHKPGDLVRVKVLRGKAVLTFNVRLGAYPYVP
jgi:S1-C subfamily serine protease